MNKERLQQLLSGDFSGNAIEELEELIEKYPYFQSAYVLLSKASSENGHHAFEDHLFDAAMQIRDREQLFHNIMRPQVQKAIAKANEAIDRIPDVEDQGQPSESDVSMEEALIESDESEDLKGVSSNPTISDSFVQQTNESEFDEPLSIDEQVAINQEKGAEITKDLDPELEEELLVHAISASIEQEVMEEMTEPIAEGENKESQEEVITSFSSWIYQRAKEIHYVQEDSESTGESDSDVSQASLIDRFIKSEPRITPLRLDDYMQPEQAAKALLEDEEFVTETLAKVYASQGNVKKALKAYKLLALKFPEKSVYFANQIKKLGNQFPKK